MWTTCSFVNSGVYRHLIGACTLCMLLHDLSVHLLEKTKHGVFSPKCTSLYENNKKQHNIPHCCTCAQFQYSTCLSPPVAPSPPAAALPLTPFAFPEELAAAAAAATTPTFATVVLGDALATTAAVAPALTGAAAAATFPINLGFFAVGDGDACFSFVFFPTAVEHVT